jgi:hypothetical protein
MFRSTTALRRAFTFAAVAWALMLPAAAYAAGRPAAPRIVYAFALAVYGIGSAVCHQLPLRSFHLFGAQMAVCARCTGIYAGAAAVAAALIREARGSGATLAARASRGPASRAGGARLVMLVAVLPTIATLAYEWTTGLTPANWIRATAGVPMGAAVSWLVVRHAHDARRAR